MAGLGPCPSHGIRCPMDNLPPPGSISARIRAQRPRAACGCVTAHVRVLRVWEVARAHGRSHVGIGGPHVVAYVWAVIRGFGCYRVGGLLRKGACFRPPTPPHIQLSTAPPHPP